MAGKFKYNPGDRLGPHNILMVERTEKMPNGRWKAKFVCPYDGNIFETLISCVTSGDTQSCGCAQKRNAIKQGHNNFVDLSRKRFGRLIAIKTVGKKENGNFLWYCECDCGGNKIVSNSDLRLGRVASCGCLNSKGEAKIKQILEELKIYKKKEYSFNDCVSENNIPLRYDFYLPDYNILIEYDGKQHFEYTGYGWSTEENLKKTQQRDKIKNEYANKNNICLIRIPYTDLNKLSKEYILDLLNKK